MNWRSCIVHAGAVSLALTILSCSAILGDFSLGNPPSDGSAPGDGSSQLDCGSGCAIGDATGDRGPGLDAGHEVGPASDASSDGILGSDATSDSTRLDGPPASDSPIDGIGSDAADATAMPCTPADNVCADANTLRACNAAGTALETTSCVAGCSSTGGAHCQRLYPAAPVVDADILVTGVMAITFPSGKTVLNPDTGAITGGFMRSANTITTNVEVNAGVAFHQTGGVGIFSFGSLTIASGANVDVIGSNAVALVSEGSLLVSGVLDVRAMDASGNVCPSGSTVAGPGGAAGGAAGTGGPTPQGGAMGGGTGGGGPGARAIQGDPGGGGGAGHAAAGGAGAGGCHTGSVALAGGMGGASYSSALIGGSGGGGGGVAPGGGGGGAIALVAATVITIGDGTAIQGINAGGCGGTGGLGGGGGGSGGTIVLEAPFVQVGAQGTLAANGGGGGGNTTSGSVDGQTGQLGAAVAYGGGSTQYGLVAGNGGAGDQAAGGAAATAICGSLEGLGGGGAVGLITLRAMGAMPTINAQGVISPSKTSGAASFAAADVH